MTREILGLNRYDLSLGLLTVRFTDCPNLLRLWFSETRRVGATEAPSSVCSGRWTIRLSSRYEVLTGSAVTKGGSIIGHSILCLTAMCLSVSVYLLDLSLSLNSRLFRYKLPSYAGTRSHSIFLAPLIPPFPFPVDDSIGSRFPLRLIVFLFFRYHHTHS